MIVDFPGVMMDFADVPSGEFFIFIEDREPNLAMKIFDSAEKKAAVMSFSTTVHASMTPPTVFEGGQFQNVSVCVVRDVVIRPPFEMKNLRDDSPSLDRPGPIIFAVGASYIRAYAQRGTIDVDLKTGTTEACRNHPGSTWLDNWEIVWIGGSKEKILAERGQPAAA
jgi:hypothetical protein